MTQISTFSKLSFVSNSPQQIFRLEAINVEIQNKLVVEHVVTFLWRVTSSFDHEEKRIVLNDDSCADESRDEALKDCFVDAKKNCEKNQSKKDPCLA